MSTITAIRAVEWTTPERINAYTYDCEYEGWEVVTDDQTVRIGIENEQSCCERWGYTCSEDDPARFVGAELLRVERVDGDTTLIPEGFYEGGTIFVNIVTDRGKFQLAVYNEHNGYYGHDGVVISRDLNISETL